jgi:four helix bundle protein
MRNFRELGVWNDSISLVTDIYTILKGFPTEERYVLSDQIRRAAISIASNIAEGSSRESNKEYSHFLQISIGSAFELETQLIIANNLEYLSGSHLKELRIRLNSIEKRLNKMITVLKNIPTTIQSPKPNSQIPTPNS